MKRFKNIIFVIICLLVSISAVAQDRINQIETQLKSMTTDVPGLEENVQMSVSGVSIQEFMRGIADAHKLNISVDPRIEQNIVNNFANATVSDVLLFVCKEYDLKINFIGTIMSLVKYEAPKPVVVAPPKKELKVKYNQPKDELTLDLKDDPLDVVVKAITQKSKKNVVIASGVASKTVSVYIENMPFENALQKLGVANNLVINKSEDNVYVVGNAEPITNNNSQKGNRNNSKNNSRKSNNRNQNNSGGDFDLEAKSFSDISVSGEEVAIDEVIKSISDEIGINYYFVSDIKDKATVNVKSTSFKDLLANMFQGTDLTYELKNGIYIIGERKTEGLRMTKVVQLQYRSVETVNEFIPADIKKDVDVKEFLDLNSLILSGSEPRIEEIEQFIKRIDKVVPVVLIEVMIVDYSNNRTNSLGLQAGIGENPAGPTTGTIFPEANMNLNSTSVNKLIESFNGYGILNLGKVTPNFYLNINALETQGVLRVKSTPKLATLNGHEATMTIGNTEYYVEERNVVTANTSTVSQSTRQYKSVTADLSVTIKPMVSGDDQITMEIAVSQSDFTAKIEPNAPPGQVSRDFTSVIRVKDQEMVLLGGLEEKSIRESGRGVPFLSRIPFIKWFFSSRSREKKKTKLNIFIKPTVIY